MKTTLSKKDAISLVIIITITEIILNMPEYLVNITGTGTIINVLYIAIIGYFLCFVIFKLFKNFSNFDILDLADFIGGKVLKFLISIIFLSFFIISTSVAISNFTYLLKSLYFSNYSILFLLLFFIAVIIFSNLRGLRCNQKNNLFACPGIDN